MSAPTLPVAGIALRVQHLTEYREWLIAGQRDLEIGDPASPAFFDGDWRPTAREVRSILDGYTGRLGIHGPFADPPRIISVRDRLVREAVVTRIRQALDFVVAIGGTHMVLHAPFVMRTPFDITPQALADTIAATRETMETILPYAREAGCVIVWENIWCEMNGMPSRALIEAFGSESMRLSIDVGHAFIAQQHGGPTPDQRVRDHGDILAHLHLQDTDGHEDRHWAPGDGSLNWYALFAELAKLPEQPRLIIEVKEPYRNRAISWLTEQGFVR